MRVLHVVTSGELGGAQVHVATLVRELVRSGVEAAVACGPGDYLPGALVGVAPVHRVPWLRSSPASLADLRSLIALMRLAHGRDVVHTHSAKAGVLGRIAAHLVGVPQVMHTSHGSFLAEPRPRWARLLLLAVERVAGGLTDHVFVLSHADLELMRSHGLYRSTAWDVVRIAPERVVRPPGAWKYRSGRGDVVTVANHYRTKGLDVLLRSFPSVVEVIPEARLRVIGDGPERAALEELVARLSLTSVTFEGRMEDPTPALLDAAIFVLPSRKEGLPLVLLEALALGVPTVVTNVGAVPETVSEGEAVLVPPEDPRRLAAAIVAVLSDGERARRLGMAGRAAARRYAASATISPILAAYTSRK